MTERAKRLRFWKRPGVRRVARWVERGFAVFGVSCLVWFVGFDLSTIVSGSMSPTLQGTSFDNGDWVLTEKFTYWFRRPRRWEVVTFRNAMGVRVMKRVVGLPGETVRQERRLPIEINGQPVMMPEHLKNLHYIPYGNLAGGKPVECGDGYYLLGDDTRDSDDSRFEGPVRPDRIMGHAWLIVHPRPRMGFVN